MSDWSAAIILGIVEGLTEFIPVSSTGHLILTHHLLFGGEEMTGFWATFEVAIQLGAILAVVVLYWSRFMELLGVSRPEGTPFPALRSLFLPDQRLGLLHILFAIFPALVAGFLLHGFIKSELFSAGTVVIGLIAGGLVMVALPYLAPKPQTGSLDSISLKQSFLIGLGQCLSLWPGVSRSGATIITGIFTGLGQKTAAEFSFIVAVPVMMAATGYDLLKSWSLITSDTFVTLAIGFVVSFLVAIAAIKGFLSLLSRIGLPAFGWYRIVAGLAFGWFFLW